SVFGRRPSRDQPGGRNTDMSQDATGALAGNSTVRPQRALPDTQAELADLRLRLKHFISLCADAECFEHAREMMLDELVKIRTENEDILRRIQSLRSLPDAERA